MRVNGTVTHTSGSSSRAAAVLNGSAVDIIFPLVEQGAGAILPDLHTEDAPPERTCNPEISADLAEVYRDGDDGDGDGSAAGAPRTASLLAAVSGTSEKAGGGDEEWESANDRMEASLRGGVSLTSLDLSSPRITIEFIKR